MDRPTLVSTPPFVNATAGGERRYWLDAARAALMLLGIPYHVAMLYSSPAWVLASPDGSALLDTLARASSAFRMPCFFLVAGYFAAMLLQRRPVRVFVGQRSLRLGLPLLACLIALSPLQVGLLQFASGLVVDGHPLGTPFWLDGEVAAGAGQLAILHLWFLLHLLLYTWLLAACWPSATVRTWIRRAGSFAERAPASLLVVLVFAHSVYPMGLAGWDLVTGHAIPDFAWGALSTQKWLVQLPYFLAGVIACGHPALLDRLTRWHPGGMAMAACALLVHALWPEQGGLAQKAGGWVASTVASWAGIYLVLALCRRHADRPMRAVSALVDSSYSIYLFHMLFVLSFGLLFAFVDAPPTVEFVVLTALTLAGAWALHQLLAPSPLYRLLFNGERPAAGQAARVGHARGAAAPEAVPRARSR